MNKKEFMIISSAIVSAYPSSKVLASPQDMEFWYSMLRDLDYGLAQNAVIEHIQTNRFPPGISEIREQCMKRKTNIPEWGEAWRKMTMAIRNFGMYREADALASLDDFTAEATRRMGYQTMCTCDISDEMANRAQFRDIYNAIVKRSTEKLQMSPDALAARENLQESYLQPPKPVASLVDIAAAEREAAMKNRASPEYVKNLLEKHGLR